MILCTFECLIHSYHVLYWMVNVYSDTSLSVGWCTRPAAWGSDSWLTVFRGSVIVFTSFSMHLPPNHQLVLTRPPMNKRQNRPGDTIIRNPLQACPVVRTWPDPAASKTWSVYSPVLLLGPNRAFHLEHSQELLLQKLSTFPGQSQALQHWAKSKKTTLLFPASPWPLRSGKPVRKWQWKEALTVRSLPGTIVQSMSGLRRLLRFHWAKHKPKTLVETR